MLITQIVPLQKGRSKIYIENDFAFVLYKGEICKYGISENAILKEEDYREILTEILPKRARNRALNLLDKKDYTTEEIRRKLREGLYPEEIIEDAVLWLTDLGFLDDERYAMRYVELHYSSDSKRNILQKLSLRGIGKDVILSSLDAYEAEHPDSGERETLLAYMQRKNINPCEMSQEEIYKKQAALMRKGFSYEIISDVFRHFT